MKRSPALTKKEMRPTTSQNLSWLTSPDFFTVSSTATAVAVLDTVKKSGEVSQDKFCEVVGRISFFVNAGLRFITEICKMRAFTELWEEITRTRYGVTDPKQRLFRYGVQVNSLGLTA